MKKISTLLLLLIFLSLKLNAEDKDNYLPKEKSFGLSFAVKSSCSISNSYGGLLSFHIKGKQYRTLKLGIDFTIKKDHHYGISSLFSFYPMIKNQNYSRTQLILGIGPGFETYGNHGGTIFIEPKISMEAGGEFFINKNFGIFCSYSPELSVVLDVSLSAEFKHFYVKNNVLAGFNFYFDRIKSKKK